MARATVAAGPQDAPPPKLARFPRPKRARKDPAPAAAPAAEPLEPAAAGVLPEDRTEWEPETEIPLAMGFPPRPKRGEDFFTYLRGFSEQDWQNQAFMYLWRLAPTIDRRKTGQGTNIRKYSSFADSESIMLDEGSGAYRLDFIWNPRTGGRAKRIAQHYFTILNLKYPPQVPLGEWIDDPANDLWKWAKPALEAKQMHPNGNGGGNTDIGKLLETVMSAAKFMRPNDSHSQDAILEALRSMGTMQQQMLAAADPARQWEMIQKMLSLVNPKKDDSALVMVVDLLREDLRATRTELVELRNRPVVAPPSLIDQFKELFPLMKEARVLFGGGAKGSAGIDWPGVIEKGLDTLTAAIPVIGDAVKNAKHQAAPGVAIVDNRPALTAATNPNGQPQTMKPNPKTAAAETASKEEILKQFEPLLKQIMPILLDQFNSATGYDFRDWFLERYGSINWTAFRDQLGIDSLAEMVQEHPFLKTKLTPPAKFRTFLEAFFSDPEGKGDNGDDDDDERDDAPAGVTQ